MFFLRTINKLTVTKPEVVINVSNARAIFQWVRQFQDNKTVCYSSFSSKKHIVTSAIYGHICGESS